MKTPGITVTQRSAALGRVNSGRLSVCGVTGREDGEGVVVAVMAIDSSSGVGQVMVEIVVRVESRVMVVLHRGSDSVTADSERTGVMNAIMLTLVIGAVEDTIVTVDLKVGGISSSLVLSVGKIMGPGSPQYRFLM